MKVHFIKMTKIIILWFSLFIFLISDLPGNVYGQRPNQAGTEVRKPETASYTVIKTEKDYEERLYPASKWVSTKLTGQSVADPRPTSLFWLLFGYISGSGNEDNVTIPMTAPVTMLYEPDCSSSATRDVTMAFYIPSAFQENPPKPNNPLVFIDNRPEMKVLVRTFGGFANETEVINNEHEKLWLSLTEEDQNRVNRDGPFFLVGYDPPFILENRRNEIWMMVSSNGAEKKTCKTN